MPVSVVFEEHVAAAHGRDVEIGVAVVVDVGERGRHAHLVGHRHAGRGGDVLERAPAEVSPELIAADLRHEIDVEQAVTIDVGDGEAVTVIVVRRLVRPSRVVDDPVLEGDAALGQPIDELKVVERRDARDARELRVFHARQPGRVLEAVGHITDRALASRRRRSRLSLEQERDRRRMGREDSVPGTLHEGSSMTRTWLTFTFSSTCLVPLGHRISSRRTIVARPSPTCSRMSLLLR